jgi:hypothetical protein
MVGTLDDSISVISTSCRFFDKADAVIQPAEPPPRIAIFFTNISASIFSNVYMESI